MRISATEIRTRLESGYVVTLERNDCTWKLPAIAFHGPLDLPSWGLPDEVYTGDRLTLPDSMRPLMLVMTAVVQSQTPCAWYGWSADLLLVFFSHPACPACGTDAGHHVDIPTGLTDTDQWVVRTCITCETSWRQETYQ
ncbi:hypothetical protein H7J86_24385 [Mycobacterium hackensackense]|uniref:hypothetical protein n=1 Tax=Mycobacterium hackensackense TaxID=228909 RepID=UPI0022658B28|nr:hypothetical protein [Mycobacterium hackensackense]MCV7255306.1 hypothetical protein [Mycobacterium hackensackense]